MLKRSIGWKQWSNLYWTWYPFIKRECAEMEIKVEGNKTQQRRNSEEEEKGLAVVLLYQVRTRIYWYTTTTTNSSKHEDDDDGQNKDAIRIDNRKFSLSNNKWGKEKKMYKSSPHITFHDDHPYDHLPHYDNTTLINRIKLHDYFFCQGLTCAYI